MSYATYAAVGSGGHSRPSTSGGPPSSSSGSQQAHSPHRQQARGSTQLPAPLAGPPSHSSLPPPPLPRGQQHGYYSQHHDPRDAPPMAPMFAPYPPAQQSLAQMYQQPHPNAGPSSGPPQALPPLQAYQPPAPFPQHSRMYSDSHVLPYRDVYSAQPPHGQPQTSLPAQAHHAHQQHNPLPPPADPPVPTMPSFSTAARARPPPPDSAPAIFRSRQPSSGNAPSADPNARAGEGSGPARAAAHDDEEEAASEDEYDEEEDEDHEEVDEEDELGSAGEEAGPSSHSNKSPSGSQARKRRAPKKGSKDAGTGVGAGPLVFAPGSSTAVPAAGKRVDGRDRPQKRRKRANMSCTQCKSRKIKCDRARPVCGSCVRRGIPPQKCLLGDARDDYERIMSAPDTAQVAQLLQRIARLEEELEQSTREKAECEEAHERELSALRAAEALAEENVSVSNHSRHSALTAATSTDAMEQRLLVDAEVAQSHHQDRERMHSLSNGPMLSAATNFALNLNASSYASIDEMLASLPSEAQILATVDWYYRNLEPVWNFLPSHSSFRTRIEDLWKRYRTFITSRNNIEQGVSPDGLHTRAPQPPGSAPLSSPALSHDQARSASSRPATATAAGAEQGFRRRSSAASLPNVGQSLSKSDYAFLALLFALLETSSEYMSDEEILENGIAATLREVPARMSAYHRNCVKLLSMSDMLALPTLEGIQAVSMLRTYYFARQRRTEYTVLHTMVIRMAEGMGLHRLQSARADEKRWKKRSASTAGSPASPGQLAGVGRKAAAGAEPSEQGSLVSGTMNRADLHGWFLPKGEHKEKWEEMNASRWHDGDHEMRELGRRVWWALVFVDWQTATLHDGVYHAREGMFSTGLPLNADLEEIARAQDPLAIASPEKSFIAIMMEIAKATRGTADAMNSGQGSYEDSARIEHSHRQILAGLPYYYQFPSAQNAKSFDAARIEAAHAKQPFLATQRVLIHLYVHHRLLKLHRLYMARAYRDTAFARSRDVCLESAELLLGCFSELVRANSPMQRQWSFRMMLFDAISTIQIDLLHRIAQDPHQTILRRQADVELGIRMLQPKTTMDHLSKFLPAAISALRALQLEERRKRAAFKREQQRAQASGVEPPTPTTQAWTIQLPASVPAPARRSTASPNKPGSTQREAKARSPAQSGADARPPPQQPRPPHHQEREQQHPQNHQQPPASLQPLLSPGSAYLNAQESQDVHLQVPMHAHTPHLQGQPQVVQAPARDAAGTAVDAPAGPSDGTTGGSGMMDFSFQSLFEELPFPELEPGALPSAWAYMHAGSQAELAMQAQLQQQAHQGQQMPPPFNAQHQAFQQQDPRLAGPASQASTSTDPSTGGPAASVPAGPPPADQREQFQMDLDEWLRSISGTVASEQGNVGAAKLIDKLIEEMDWSW